MSTDLENVPDHDVGEPSDRRRASVVDWLTTTDHKRIGLVTMGVGTFLFFVVGALAMVIRAQLALPEEHLVTGEFYDSLFTIHGSGMIYLVLTPFAVALGVYLVPLQIGAPAIAAPRVTMLGFWLYALGALTIFAGFAVSVGPAQAGWYAYPPLSDSQHTPGSGQSLWIAGVALAGAGVLLQAGTVLWTALLRRPRRMTLLRMPIFAWSQVATTMMVIASFPALLAAMFMLAVGRVRPEVFADNTWVIGYQHLFWFFAHPVVYVMFFPYVGCVMEVAAVFSGRRFFGYRAAVLAFLTFSAFSMSVWAHHMFSTGQVSNDYYSLTSILLIVPAGVEYFDILGTVAGGRLRFRTPMLFALAWLPQFLIGGLTGIMTASPVVDYHITDSYFIVAHWHYTLMAGSVFGLFAGFYFWFPKATGLMLDEKLGRAHFWLLTVGTNLTFLPMFWLGMSGMPRRYSTYLAADGFAIPNLLSTIGAGIFAVAQVVFAINVIRSTRYRRRPAGDDPWGAFTVEWATSSPPPPTNFDAEHPLPEVRSYAPLLDLREDRERQARETTS